MKRRTYHINTILIVTTIVVITISLSLFFLILTPRVEQRFIEEEAKNNYEIAHSASDYFDSIIQEQLSILVGIDIAHQTLADGDMVFDDAYYQSIITANEYIRGIEILDQGNEIIYSSYDQQGRVGINLTNLEIIEHLDTIHDYHISSLKYVSDFDGLAVDLAYAGEDATVLALISVEFFNVFGEEFQLSFEDKDIMILDDYGKFIFDSKNNQHLILNRYSGFEKLLEYDNKDEVYYFTIDNQQAIVSVVTMNVEEWHVVVYEDVTIATMLNNSNNLYYTATVLFIVVLFVVVYSLLQYLFVSEVHYLGNNLLSVGEGEFKGHLPDTHIEEFNVLRGRFNQMNINLNDLTERLSYLAYHDETTKLPNKNKCADDFSEWKKEHINWALLYIDISRFSVINENYGYHIGDYVLRQIADALTRFYDHVYRAEGDEYIVLQRITEEHTLENVFEQIDTVSHYIANNTIIYDNRISMDIKIGVVSSPEHDTTIEGLVQKAIIAMHDILLTGHKNYMYYDDSQSSDLRRKSRIELLISRAIKQREFRTVFQPVINIKDRSIRGFEALSRWTSIELGIVTPDEFIPILERSRRIHTLDKLVLEDAMRMGNYIHKEFGRKIVTSVNISVETIMRDDFTTIVDDALEKYHYDPHFLELEITESTIIEDFDAVTQKMSYLRDKGVRFSEDDFGDAYSSLTYLTRLDIDTLKISKNFLASMLSNVESRVLVQTIIELSKQLGFLTIVEGIETEEHLQLFEQYGCDFVQGYLFFRPMSEDAIIKLFESQQEKD